MPVGVYVRTEETRKNLGISQKEIWKRPGYKEKRSGKNNPNYRKHTWSKDLTKETDERVRRISESQKGKHHSPKTEFKKGKDHPNYGKHPSKETLEKRSKSLKGKLAGEKHPMWGKHHPKKTRDKMSKSHTGKPNSEEHNRNISKANIGKYISEETRKKIGDGNRGKYVSPETRINMSKATKGENNPFWGKTHTEKSIEKIKKARAKQIFPKRDSKIEIKIREFLDKLQIEYFQHKHMNIQHYYQCDFFIPSFNLILEADGDYWHKYPVGNELDHIRTKELLEKGFKVLRLWEREINDLGLKGFEDIIVRVKEEVN